MVFEGTVSHGEGLLWVLRSNILATLAEAHRVAGSGTPDEPRAGIAVDGGDPDNGGFRDWHRFP
jgi:hypothetical protein